MPIPAALLLGPLLWTPTLPDPPQDRTAQEAAPAPGVLPKDTPAEARAAWERFLTSTYGAEPTPPIDAIRFRVEVLRRDAAATNEATLTLEFLAPHFLHVTMDSGREQGRGPGTNGRTRDWYREEDRVVDLVGREYASDREQLDRMATLCRNFLALANPDRLRLEKVALASAPRGTKEGKSAARKLQWLSFESPDFHLPGALRPRAGEPAPRYEVLLGLDPASGAVRRAQVAPRNAPGAPRIAPVFLSFDRHGLTASRAQGGVNLPHEIRLYDLESEGPFGPRFRERATVEVYVLSGELGPDLAPADFLPG